MTKSEVQEILKEIDAESTYMCECGFYVDTDVVASILKKYIKKETE